MDISKILLNQGALTPIQGEKLQILLWSNTVMALHIQFLCVICVF